MDAGIEDASEYRTGLISASTVGGIDKTERFFSKFVKDRNHGRLRDVLTHEWATARKR